jgi:glycine cleavage system regulatory protein
METTLVMTILGQDRPGLVEAVAGIVSRHGGNWLESRMSRLGGQFAGILRVRAPEDRREALVASLQSLGPQGLTVVIYAESGTEPGAAGKQAALEVMGHDRPGIVRQISQALTARKVNVEELNTECVSAPMSGEMLFQARARVLLPASCDLESLRADLEKIASDLVVELKLAEVL